MIVLVDQDQFSKLRFYEVQGMEFPIITFEDTFFSGTIIDFHGELYYENGEFTGFLSYSDRIVH